MTVTSNRPGTVNNDAGPFSWSEAIDRGWGLGVCWSAWWFCKTARWLDFRKSPNYKFPRHVTHVQLSMFNVFVSNFYLSTSTNRMAFVPLSQCLTDLNDTSKEQYWQMQFESWSSLAPQVLSFFANIALCPLKMTPLEMTKVKIQTSLADTLPVPFGTAWAEMSRTKVETCFPFGSLVHYGLVRWGPFYHIHQ